MNRISILQSYWYFMFHLYSSLLLFKAYRCYLFQLLLLILHWFDCDMLHLRFPVFFFIPVLKLLLCLWSIVFIHSISLSCIWFLTPRTYSVGSLLLKSGYKTIIFDCLWYELVLNLPWLWKCVWSQLLMHCKQFNKTRVHWNTKQYHQ